MNFSPADQSWKDDPVNSRVGNAQETGNPNTEPHRYLELIYDEQDTAPVTDGYEVPRVPNNKQVSRCRTFSVSSTASEGSGSTVSYPPSAPLVEQTITNNATYIGSKPMDLSSLEKLLPTSAIPNGFKCELESEFNTRLNGSANVS